ncbi:cupin domain-containing protein [Azospirillum agricola]|uniref:cupin domain-containing protein n=1 Tax=Azospirillum agricola TaxID=1720247 RepID=UPI000A0F236B|nr:cupin domain-containing protein [Azospirillum agricola]SMH36151.1 Cupin domain-containing protein [Azospirillum lipoferum]
MKILASAAQETPVITPEGAERRVLSYGPGLMLVEFTFKPGTVAPMHSHPHEQVGYIVSGALELTMDGHGTEILGAGASYYVPPGTMHGVTILEPTVLVDAFTPVREDFLG